MGRLWFAALRQAHYNLGFVEGSCRRYPTMPYRWKHEIKSGEHEWLFKRNCALTPGQCAGWFAGIGLFSMTISLLFAAQGAWMVVPFAVIEVMGLFAAFYWFSRHAADYEKVRIGPDGLEVVTSVGPQLDHFESPSRWPMVQYGGQPSDLIDLAVGTEHVFIGRFVPSSKRARLAKEIRSALRGIYSGR